MIPISENHFLSINDQLNTVIRKIDQGAIGIVLVLDQNNRLLGTVTDGDVRRGLLNGLTLDCPVSKIMKTNCIFANVADSKEKLIALASTRDINQIPLIDDKKTVIGIAKIKDLMSQTKSDILDNQVIIMAGGQGQRLMPLTMDTPKPMLSVGDRPILETIIRGFSNQGFKNFVICVNYLSEKIINYFGDGKYFGVDIKYIQEKEKLGTAGALSLLEQKPNRPFFVINGDLLTNLNFKNFLEFHQNSKSMITMGVKQYSQEVPYGVVKINDNQVLSIEEKPIQSYFINAGIYVIEPNFLNCVPKNLISDMPSLIAKMIKENEKVSCFPIWEQWLDIGRHEDFMKAHGEFREILT